MKTELIVLAPARPPSEALAQDIAGLLVKADRVTGVAGDDAGLYGDLFARVPQGWPAAALTRQLDAGDGGDHAWLRCDPAHFRVEPGNVRLLACGDLGQDSAEVAELLASLTPLFGDEGFELSAPHPARWYLRAFSHNAAPDLPDLPAVEVALGGDLFELWPEDDVHRRWRRIFSEAQIVLAQHPVNEARARLRKPTINGLWFWGAGRLPQQVRSERVSAIVSDDALLQAWAAMAGVQVHAHWPEESSGKVVVLDLRQPPDTDAMLERLLAQWHSGKVGVLQWRAPSSHLTLRRNHRWRFWRR